MWVEFAVGSCPCSEGFPLSSSVFLPPQKPTFQILFQPGESGQEEPPYGMFTAKIQSIPHKATREIADIKESDIAPLVFFY